MILSQILFAGLEARREEVMGGFERLDSDWHETTKDRLTGSSQGETLGLDFTAERVFPLVHSRQVYNNYFLIFSNWACCYLFNEDFQQVPQGLTISDTFPCRVFLCPDVALVGIPRLDSKTTGEL